MFKDKDTSEIIRFINSYRNDESKSSREEYNLALTELESRSNLMAMVYKV